MIGVWAGSFRGGTGIGLAVVLTVDTLLAIAVASSKGNLAIAIPVLFDAGGGLRGSECPDRVVLPRSTSERCRAGASIRAARTLAQDLGLVTPDLPIRARRIGARSGNISPHGFLRKGSA